jgi:ribosomal protein S12 methylthiotransferase accessory factor
MQVAVVGDGPAAEAIEAAVGDAGASAIRADPDALGQAGFGVVVGRVGHPRFERAHAAAHASETRWVAVELGGVGGQSVAGVEAAVAGFAPGTACFECLRTRVAANDPETGTGRPDDATARLAGALAGREAARLLAGGESTVLGGVIELPYAERRVLPVPHCDCDPGREWTLSRDFEARDLQAALANAELALDDRVGLGHEVGEAESFPAPYYLAALADTTGFSDVQAARHTAGVDPDWNAAFMKALGEALERYCAGVYRERDLLTIAENPVAPDAFVAPEESAEAPAWWVPGADLATGDRRDLPAEFVLFPPPERHVRPAITTGLGLGNSGTEALLSGLYEVVERDAAMLAWYSTYDPLGLDVADEGYETLAKHARAEGLAVTALLLTQDVDVPVVAACVHREGEWPRFAAGMSADLDPAAAARSALAEALQNWMELRGMGEADAAAEPGAIGPYAAFPDAAREFVSPAATVPASSVGPGEVPTGAAELDSLVERVTAAGLAPYAARLTTRDVAQLGFEAVRVVVPTAQPLFTDDPYFGERAATVPTDLGFEARLGRDHHPFP